MPSKPYVVKQGDYLTKLAYLMGFKASDVWDDPQNADLKASRASMDVLYPTDVIYIPDTAPEPQALAGGTANAYAADVPKVTVDLLFSDLDKPLANEPCEITGLSGSDASDPKTTDGDGKLSLEVPVTIREFNIKFPGKDLEFTVAVGDMDPHTVDSGIMMRLQKLGYMPDVTDDSEDDVAAMMSIALFAYQTDNGIPVTSTIDDATRSAILAEHKL
jgi:hypothetical protein